MFYQGKWGTVCGTNATFDLAIVACRQLGYRETVALKTNAYFGRGSGPVWLEPACYAGMNSTVVDCIHAGWGETACDHSQDVGVICSGEPTLHSFIFIRTCTCTCSFIRTCTCTCSFIRTCTCTCSFIRTCTCTCSFIRTCTCTCSFICTCTYMFLYMYMFTCLHVYGYLTHTILQRLYP